MAPQPDTLVWSHYTTNKAHRCTRHRGALADLHAFIDDLGRQVLPKTSQGKPDKGASPVISQAAYGDGRSKDANCEAIAFVWFDVDGAASRDAMRAALQRSGVAAIFTESNSRVPNKWHLIIPLSTPILFARGETTRRASYKIEYAHAAGVLGALASFKGVSGSCGFDLRADRLLQAMYPPLRRTEEELPSSGSERLEGAALDWPAFLAATGFDLSAAVQLEERSRGGPRTRATPRPARDPFDGAIGAPIQRAIAQPLGLALQAVGFLGPPKDVHSLRAFCPFYAQHGASKGEWDACYFPASDHWWCSHNSCRGLRRDDVLAIMPQAGRDAYARATKSARTYAAVERRRVSMPETTSWLSLWMPKPPTVPTEKVPIEPAKVIRALTASMLSYGFSDDFVARSTSSVGSLEGAKKRVTDTIMRRRAGLPVASTTWLRQALGPKAMLELVTALHKDSGSDPAGLVRSFFGLGLVRGQDADWLTSVHDGLSSESPVRAAILRPTRCWRLWDELVAVCIATRTVVGLSPKVCEQIGCPRCFVLRITLEAKLLETGWTDMPDDLPKEAKRALPDMNTRMEKYGSRVEGWKDRGPFFMFKITGLRDWKALEDVRYNLKRYCRFPKLTLITVENGLPVLLLITTDGQTAGAVRGMFGRNETLTETRTDDYKEAIAAVTLARAQLHSQALELVAKRDRDGLVSWLSWIKAKHLVTRSPSGLPWPSRQVMRDHLAAERGLSKLDLTKIQYDYMVYNLIDEMGTRIHTQEYPHTHYEGIKRARESFHVKRTEASIARSEEPAHISEELERNLSHDIQTENRSSRDLRANHLRGTSPDVRANRGRKTSRAARENRGLRTPHPPP